MAAAGLAAPAHVCSAYLETLGWAPATVEKIAPAWTAGASGGGSVDAQVAWAKRLAFNVGVHDLLPAAGSPGPPRRTPPAHLLPTRWPRSSPFGYCLQRRPRSTPASPRRDRLELKQASRSQPTGLITWEVTGWTHSMRAPGMAGDRTTPWGPAKGARPLTARVIARCAQIELGRSLQGWSHRTGDCAAHVAARAKMILPPSGGSVPSRSKRLKILGEASLLVSATDFI
jgi:hypothetical protein